MSPAFLLDGFFPFGFATSQVYNYQVGVFLPVDLKLRSKTDFRYRISGRNI
jgi:hypothetical protein